MKHYLTGQVNIAVTFPVFVLKVPVSNIGGVLCCVNVSFRRVFLSANTAFRKKPVPIHDKETEAKRFTDVLPSVLLKV
jgi:hypothetical protein